MVRLGEVCSVRREVVDPSSVSAETLYLGLEDIERGGNILRYRTAIEVGLTSSKFAFTSTDVLYGKLRPNLGKIARPNRTGICSTDILPLAAGDDLDRDYLGYYLSQPKMVNYAASRTSGANLPRISPKTLMQIPIPLPSLAEQRRIVSILDRADAIRVKRRRILANLDELKRSVFLDMFGDPVSNPCHWQRKIIGEVFDVTSAKRIYAKDWSDSGVPFLRLGNLTSRINGIADESSLFIDEALFQRLRSSGQVPKAGDILMTARGTLGTCYLMKDEDAFYFQDGMITWLKRNEVTTRIMDSAFAMGLFAMSSFRHGLTKGSGGSTVSYLSIKAVANHPVITPPLSLQREFADRVAKIEQTRAKVEQALKLDDELFASLQSRAFRGGL